MQFIETKSATRLLLDEGMYNKWALFHFYLIEIASRLHRDYILFMASRLRQRSADRINKEDVSMQRNEFHAYFYYRYDIELVDCNFT